MQPLQRFITILKRVRFYFCADKRLLRLSLVSEGSLFVLPFYFELFSFPLVAEMLIRVYCGGLLLLSLVLVRNGPRHEWVTWQTLTPRLDYNFIWKSFATSRSMNSEFFLHPRNEHKSENARLIESSFETSHWIHKSAPGQYCWNFNTMTPRKSMVSYAVRNGNKNYKVDLYSARCMFHYFRMRNIRRAWKFWPKQKSDVRAQNLIQTSTLL